MANLGPSVLRIPQYLAISGCERGGLDFLAIIRMKSDSIDKKQERRLGAAEAKDTSAANRTQSKCLNASTATCTSAISFSHAEFVRKVSPRQGV
jgi:hypothetical protein